MSKILILKGLPGSGKTTWAKAYCEKNKDWIRISRDDLRNMRGTYWIPKQEGLISAMELSCADIALEQGYNVILDATNLNEKYLINWKSLADCYKTKLEYKTFDIDVDECIKRDLKRPNSVGRDVIINMYNKYLKTFPDQYTPNESKPEALIVDIDGTLAHMTNRGPYEQEKAMDDKVDEVVRQIVHMHQKAGYKIIVCTGRDFEYKEVTEKWLMNNGIYIDDLYIREPGDIRKDSIVKAEMFKKFKNKYNIEFVLDDRNQVVDMWRDMGLKCLQVAPGNF